METFLFWHIQLTNATSGGRSLQDEIWLVFLKTSVRRTIKWLNTNIKDKKLSPPTGYRAAWCNMQKESLKNSLSLINSVSATHKHKQAEWYKYWNIPVLLSCFIYMLGMPFSQPGFTLPVCFTILHSTLNFFAKIVFFLWHKRNKEVGKK